jgi:hypothetical protein
MYFSWKTANEIMTICVMQVPNICLLKQQYIDSISCTGLTLGNLFPICLPRRKDWFFEFWKKVSNWNALCIIIMLWWCQSFPVKDKNKAKMVIVAIDDPFKFVSDGKIFHF